MALDDKTLNNIFKNQKKGSIDSLRSLGIAEARRQIIHMDYEKSSPLPHVSENNDNGTGYKPGTNQVQSGDTSGYKVGTNRVQSGYVNKSKDGQLGTNRVQSGFKSGDTSGYKVGTNRVQSGSELSTKILFAELTGLQREIIVYLSHECKKTRTKVTEPLTIEYLTNSLKRTYDAVKTTIKRLEKKGCLIRVKFKNGRGGWSQYEIPENLYHEVIQWETGYKSGTNRVQIGYKVGSELGTEPGTNVSSSSSLSIKETTTTELSPEWGFNITPYARFGFTTTQLKQLASLNIISTMDVEQSLMEFSYDLDNNALPPIKTTKINFLMGLLRSGHSYVSEGFKNEQEAMIAEMAKRAEGKRKKLLEERFIAWEGGLMDEERKVIKDKLPLRLMSQYHAHGMGSEEVRSWLFNYYLQMEK